MTETYINLKNVEGKDLRHTKAESNQLANRRIDEPKNWLFKMTIKDQSFCQRQIEPGRKYRYTTLGIKHKIYGEEQYIHSMLANFKICKKQMISEEAVTKVTHETILTSQNADNYERNCSNDQKVKSSFPKATSTKLFYKQMLRNRTSVLFKPFWRTEKDGKISNSFNKTHRSLLQRTEKYSAPKQKASKTKIYSLISLRNTDAEILINCQ